MKIFNRFLYSSRDIKNIWLSKEHKKLSLLYDFVNYLLKIMHNKENKNRNDP